MNTKLIIGLLAISILLSCNDDESAMLPADPQEPLIELQFTDSPIALQSTETRFAADVPYDVFEDTQFDIFLPVSDTPTGLVIFIHGGGFTGGDKAFIYTDDFNEQVNELINSGLAVATINYRLIQSGDNEGVLKSLNDSRRALQYMRYIHNELNIDKDNIVLFGTSAGASTALWLATNDDFKDLNNTDLVLRESSRVKGIALRATQSSLDIENRWLGDVFVEFGTSSAELREEFGVETLFNFYGVSSQEEYESSQTDAYRKQVDMLSLLSADDPEIWVSNTGGHNNEPTTTSSFNHHPFHAREIKRFADAAGVPNVTTYGNPVLFSNADNEDFVDFLIRKINE
ncbi:MAG: alpha/beta hydrolase [Bacteroidota bacterium]